VCCHRAGHGVPVFRFPAAKNILGGKYGLTHLPDSDKMASLFRANQIGRTSGMCYAELLQPFLFSAC
jgi:hypothetical protein